MNTPFFISWRYQRGKQKNPLVALISKFSAIGIALGVAVLIVGLSAIKPLAKVSRTSKKEQKNNRTFTFCEFYCLS